MEHQISDYKKTWRVACYIRLSKEDEKSKGGMRESESVANQRSLLQSYIKDNDLAFVKEYIDDGISGTTFDRPQFNAMINDIEKGFINMVITKDMSRLGRDYIQSGHYIEQYFPSKGVRYISLLDNIDTYLDNSNNDIAPFKAILNDMYSKDMSKKIRSVLKSKKEQGLFVGRAAPYGYKKTSDNRHQLETDPVAALVVEEIFQMFLDGFGVCKIASILSERRVPIPAVHNQINVGNMSENFGLWTHTGVRRILQNEIYTGKLIQGKYKKLNYKSKKRIENEKETWLVTPDSHEPIISQEVFDKAQRLFEARKGIRPSKHNYLLSGLFRCYDCGSYISLLKKDKKYGQVYGRCGRYVAYSKFEVCTTHSFNYTKFEEYALDLLRDLCAKYVSSAEMAEIIAKEKSNKASQEAKKLLIEKEISKIERRIDVLYEDRLNGIIASDAFKRLSEKANADTEQLKAQLEALKENPKTYQSQKEQEKIIKSFLSLKEPTRTLLSLLIDRIEVREGQEFDIYFNFPELQSIMERQVAKNGNIGQTHG